MNRRASSPRKRNLAGPHSAIDRLVLAAGKEGIMLWRQGDIFIETIPLIPATAAQQSHLVLADGELTGHSHRVADPDTALLFAHREELFLHVIGDSAHVIHQEHGTVTLPRGRYRVWRQREYDPQPARPTVPTGGIRTAPQQRDSRWVID